jgi:alpha-glucuronidase
VVDGSLHGARITGMAGVANVGSDRNWSGSQFDQANWYAFGRFAWNPEAHAGDVAEEWVRMTFGSAPDLVTGAVEMMLGSRETVVDYMTPLGLHHLMASGHHYGPGPWVHDLQRADQNPVYFHRADAAGLGFDRTKAGSGAVTRYAPEVARCSATRPVPEDSLVPPPRGRVGPHALGRARRPVTARRRRRRGEQRQWDALAPYVDAEQHRSPRSAHPQEARWKRRIAYFQTFAKRPLPAGYAARASARLLRAATFPTPPAASRIRSDPACRPKSPALPEPLDFGWMSINPR